MNKLIRIILYITAGCVGIGCAALILSFALGGRLGGENSVFGWSKDKVRDIAAYTKKQVKNQLAEEVAEYDGEYDIDQVYEDDFAEESEEFEGDLGLLTVDASSINDLSIHLQHGYLSIEESDDHLIRVSVTETSNGLTAKCEAGKIMIQDDRSGKRGREDAYVYLQIPAGMQFQNVNIQINAGGMGSECGFTAENLTANADAGQMELSEITANVFSASVGAGEIDIEDSVLKTVKLDCGVGRMDIEADITGDANITCGMGEIDMELEHGVDNVNYMLHCGAGSIQIGDNTYSGLAREKQINNGAPITFTLDCGMGYISIE